MFYRFRKTSNHTRAFKTRLYQTEIWEKYTGQEEEHGQILRWMRKLGYDTSVKTRRPNFTGNIPLMTKNKKTVETQSLGDFETLQLRKRIAELENQFRACLNFSSM